MNIRVGRIVSRTTPVSKSPALNVFINKRIHFQPKKKSSTPHNFFLPATNRPVRRGSSHVSAAFCTAKKKKTNKNIQKYNFQKEKEMTQTYSRLGIVSHNAQVVLHDDHCGPEAHDDLLQSRHGIPSFLPPETFGFSGSFYRGLFFIVKYFSSTNIYRPFCFDVITVRAG